MRTGIFGGTFNPPHKGHLRLVRCFADRLSLSRVIIIPTHVPPHKAANDLAAGDDRLEMCRLLFADDERLTVSDTELQRGGKSYTYDTLARRKALYPDEELYLIIGSDMLRSFMSWYRAEDILGLCTVCAAARDDSGVEQTVNGAIILNDTDPIDISSTELRQMVSDGADIEPFVGAQVADYIRRRGLYR